MKSLFVFYVEDQKKSARFYEAVLAKAPALDVPGMTQFDLGDGTQLGLMPSVGIKQLLGDKLPDPSQAQGVPRAELYLIVTDAEGYHRRALDNGAVELSPMQERDWGDRAGYCLDSDGHVLAFAEAK